MAIDTAAKRRSASGVGHRIGGRGITPNSSKPVAWRQQAGWGYSGIEAAEAEVTVGAPGGVFQRLNGISRVFRRIDGLSRVFRRAEGLSRVFRRN